MKWKLRNEGCMDIKSTRDAELVVHIIRVLEYQLKGKDKYLADRINHLRGKP